MTQDTGEQVMQESVSDALERAEHDVAVLATQLGEARERREVLRQRQMAERVRKSLVEQEWEKNPRAMYDAHREIWRDKITELTTDLQAAQGTITEARAVATAAHVYNTQDCGPVVVDEVRDEIVDILSRTDRSAFDAAIQAAKSEGWVRGLSYIQMPQSEFDKWVKDNPFQKNGEYDNE